MQTALRAKSKSKAAPRSSSQFKVGPSFQNLELENKIYTSSGKQISPVVCARIDRGFEVIGNEWVGYKRNYFTLVASFNLQDHSFEKFLKDSYTVTSKSEAGKQPVKYFTLKVVSRCLEDNLPIALVQHTAKRESGPQGPPPVYPAIPGAIPSHDTIRSASNIRNKEKIASLNNMLFYTLANHKDSNSRALSSYPPLAQIARVARYERLQFSSSINFRKPLLTTKHFVLTVQLHAVTDDNREIIVGSCETVPLVIRGRSPATYKCDDPATKTLSPVISGPSRQIPESQEHQPLMHQMGESQAGKPQNYRNFSAGPKVKRLKLRLDASRENSIDSNATVEQNSELSGKKVQFESAFSLALTNPFEMAEPSMFEPAFKTFSVPTASLDYQQEAVREQAPLKRRLEESEELEGDAYYSYVNIAPEESGLLSFDLMDVENFDLESLKLHAQTHKKRKEQLKQSLVPIARNDRSHSSEAANSELDAPEGLYSQASLMCEGDINQVYLLNLYEHGLKDLEDLFHVSYGEGEEIVEINSSQFVDYNGGEE